MAPAPARGGRAGAGRARLVEGLVVVGRSPVLRRTLVVVALAALAQGAFVVLFVLFVVRDLGASEADVGVLRGVQAAGSIAAGLLLAPLVRRIDPGRLLAVSLGVVGALSLVIWNGPQVTTAFGVYVALFVAVGAPALTTMTGLMTLVQTHAAPEVRGRVMSTVFAVLGGVQAGGMLVAGLVGTGGGLTAALEVQGCLYLAAALMRAAWRPGRRRRRPSPGYDFAPSGRRSSRRRRDPADGYTREDLAEHVRTEHSTYRWLLEPMLAAAGFEVVEAAFAGRVYGAYTCVRREAEPAAGRSGTGPLRFPTGPERKTTRSRVARDALRCATPEGASLLQSGGPCNPWASLSATRFRVWGQRTRAPPGGQRPPARRTRILRGTSSSRP